MGAIEVRDKMMVQSVHIAINRYILCTKNASARATPAAHPPYIRDDILGRNVISSLSIGSMANLS